MSYKYLKSTTATEKGEDDNGVKIYSNLVEDGITTTPIGIDRTLFNGITFEIRRDRLQAWQNLGSFKVRMQYSIDNQLWHDLSDRNGDRVEVIFQQNTDPYILQFASGESLNGQYRFIVSDSTIVDAPGQNEFQIIVNFGS